MDSQLNPRIGQRTNTPRVGITIVWFRILDWKNNDGNFFLMLEHFFEKPFFIDIHPPYCIVPLRASDLAAEIPLDYNQYSTQKGCQ